MLIAAQFRQRLHLRGFPFWFLAKAFATGPRYEQRSDFLKPPAANTATTPSIVFSTVFNRHLQQCSLPKAIFLHQTWLPSHFDEVTFINAWRVGRKLGGQLIAFKFPKPPRPYPRGCDSCTLQPAAVGPVEAVTSAEVVAPAVAAAVVVVAPAGRKKHKELTIRQPCCPPLWVKGRVFKRTNIQGDPSLQRLLEETAGEKLPQVQKVLCNAHYHVTQKEIENFRMRLAQQAALAPEVEPQELLGVLQVGALQG